LYKFVCCTAALSSHCVDASACIVNSEAECSLFSFDVRYAAAPSSRYMLPDTRELPEHPEWQDAVRHGAGLSAQCVESADILTPATPPQAHTRSPHLQQLLAALDFNGYFADVEAEQHAGYQSA
jgi:hypothetical protein